MRFRNCALPVALVVAFSLFTGCTPKRQALRAEETGVAVRLPPAEAMDVRLRSERLRAPPELPYSVADETRDRWLTLFEVTFLTVYADNLPEKEPVEE